MRIQLCTPWLWRLWALVGVAGRTFPSPPSAEITAPDPKSPPTPQRHALFAALTPTGSPNTAATPAMTRLQLLQALLLAVAGLSAVFPSSALAQQTQDWLRTPVQAAATVVQPDATTIVLGNSLLTRTFTTSPAFGTVNLEVNATLAHGGRRSLLRAFKPEGYVTLDNTTYALGWNLPLRCRERERVVCSCCQTSHLSPTHPGGLTQNSTFLAYLNRTAPSMAALPAGLFSTPSMLS